MLTVNPHYITDKKGKKISVVLPIKDFNALMEELEELEDIRMYDESVTSGDKPVPLEEAFKIIEKSRKIL
jgi:PHD/YefM family antitoxin component YafN of YafNO toxin-antitoxin module